MPLVRADHFDAAMKTARRSVSPQDVLKYQEFARTLAQWRGLPSTHASVCVPSTYLHTSTPPLSFLQAGCPSCRPNNSVKALKASSCSTSCDRQTDRQTDGQTAGRMDGTCQASIYKWRMTKSPLRPWTLRRRGVVVSGVRRMNEVNSRRARLVLGWVTVFGT